MRVLVTAMMPHETFNAAIREGTAGSKLFAILESIKPEAVYFTEIDGRRCAMLIVDLPDASKIPALAEPWFLNFNADCTLRILMTPDDLKRADLEGLGKKWG
jgi:hypothetical protein